MACEKLSLSSIPSKSEKHAPARQMDGLPDHDCHIALDRWRAAVGRLHRVLKSSEICTQITLVKNLDGAMQEIRRAAILMVIRDQILNGEKGGI